MEIISGIVAVFVSMFSYILVDYVGKFLFKKKSKTKENYNERLKQLTTNLLNASKEVDNILNELALVAEGREKSVNKLEKELYSLSRKEQELKNKIETLEKVPLPVAEHFASLLEGGEKRNRRRDYLLFGAGVLVTTIISLILNSYNS